MNTYEIKGKKYMSVDSYTNGIYEVIDVQPVRFRFKYVTETAARKAFAELKVSAVWAIMYCDGKMVDWFDKDY